MAETIAPKDKAFLSIKIVQESMDTHAKRIAIAFGDYLQSKYRYCEIRGAWYDFKNDPHKHWPADTKYIYHLFIESINK